MYMTFYRFIYECNDSGCFWYQNHCSIKAQRIFSDCHHEKEEKERHNTTQNIIDTTNEHTNIAFKWFYDLFVIVIHLYIYI